MQTGPYIRRSESPSDRLVRADTRVTRIYNYAFAYSRTYVSNVMYTGTYEIGALFSSWMKAWQDTENRLVEPLFMVAARVSFSSFFSFFVVIFFHQVFFFAEYFLFLFFFRFLRFPPRMTIVDLE